MRSSRARPIVTLVALAAVGFAGCRSRSEPPHARNVVLISIDTCRADHLGCYGYRGGTTPHIDRLAEEGALFESAMAPVPLTLPSHATLLTGTWPVYHGVHDNEGFRLAEESVTLAETLAAHGLATAGIVSSHVMGAKFGLAQGFGSYRDEVPGKNSPYVKDPTELERGATETAALAVDWLDGHAGEDFFLFVHFFDPHAPYDPPALFRERFPDSPYAGEIAHVDAAIGTILETLRRLGVYDQTLIVVVGDHGESLGEHGESRHGYFVYQPTMRVPLVVRGPGGARGVRIVEPVSLADVFPTVLDVLGFPIPEQAQGLSLAPALGDERAAPADRAVYLESALPTVLGATPLLGVVHGRYKYVHTARPELYDLEQDPAESDNLIERTPELAQRLRGELEDILLRHGRAPDDGSELALGEEERARLRSLGYVSGGAVETRFDLDRVLAAERAGDDPKDLIGVYEKLQRLPQLVLQRSPEVRGLCEAILAERPDTTMAWRALALADYREGRFESAIDHYQDGLAALTRNAERVGGEEFRSPILQAEIHVGIARAQESLGRNEQALESFRQARRLDPRLPGLAADIAVALAKTGRDAEAGSMLEQANAETSPLAVARAYLARALVYQHQNKDLESFEALQQCILHNPDSYEAHRDLSLVASKLGRADELLPFYRGALQRHPGSALLHRAAAVELLRRGALDEAGDHLGRALELEPLLAGELDQTGQRLLEGGRPALAAAVYDALVRHGRPSAGLLHRAARASLALGDSATAEARLRRALELDPDAADARRLLERIRGSGSP